MIALIAAVSRNRVIGRAGGLPWHLPRDQRHFRDVTMGKPVVMGRKTFEELDAPLKGRRNIVVTRQADYAAAGCEVAKSLEDALALTAREPVTFIAGGEALYAEALARADRLYLTWVHADVAGDTFFPDVDFSEWREIECDHHEADARHAYPFSIVTYERKRPAQ